MDLLKQNSYHEYYKPTAVSDCEEDITMLDIINIITKLTLGKIK